MELSEERSARNQATFREANEELAARVGELLDEEDLRPFICECADPGCTEILFLPPAEYERVRAAGDRFLVVNGHEIPQARTLASRDSHAIVEKVGAAGRVARERDPRGAEP